MTSKLGPYWSVEHRRKEDYAYFTALQPAAHLIMDGGPPDYAFVRDNEPNTLTLARDWALSEQHSDMLKFPAETGIRHAREWNDHQKQLGFDKSRTLILGINEPHIWEDGVVAALRTYTIALCGEATIYGLRVGAMQLGVGWPNNNGPDTPPNWSPFAGVEEAISRNRGALVCHEYWADRGPSEMWGWWGGRTLKCPWQVPIIIGECGVDMFVKDTSVGQQNRGWLGHMPPERYANELWEYANRMGADPRFVGCCVFASDFQAHEWYSFDVMPAYNAILGVKPADSPPTDTFLPSVGTGKPTPAYVAVPSGANLRKAPRTESDLILSVPYGKKILVYPDNANSNWSLVEYQGNSGYMSSSLYTFAKPVEPPSPTPTPTPPTSPSPVPAQGLLWPVQGAIVTQRFGENPADYAKFGQIGHNGIDLGVAVGTPVRCIADGEVMFTGLDPDYGNYCRVWIPSLSSHAFFAHLSAIQCTVGQQVKQGQVIALSGNSGNSTGPHVHFELRGGSRDAYYTMAYGYTQGRYDPQVAYLLTGSPLTPGATRDRT